MTSDLLQLRRLRRSCPRSLLAVGALVLLMVGACSRRALSGAGHVRSRSCCSSRVALLVVWLPAERRRLFNGAFIVDGFARFMKVLALVGSAVALLLSLDFCASDGHRQVRVSGAVLLATLGMMMMISANDLIALYLGLELQSLALYVLAAINRDNAALDRSRPEVFRARRAVVRHAALRRLAGLRLHRHGRASPASPRRRAGRAPSIGADLRPGVPARRPRLQDLGRAVPHVDARRLRGRADPGDRVLRRRAEGGGHGAVRARRRSTRFPADRAATGSRSSSSSRSPRWCSAPSPPSARRNIKRLMAYSSIGHIGFALVGLAAGTPDGVQGVLIYMAIYRGHDARHLRLHPVDAARRTAWSRTIDDLAGPVAHQSGRWRSSWPC